jgi:hypothetical protein
MSVQAEVQAEKNWLSQTCLSVLEIFWYLWYLWYPGDPPRDAESLGRSLYLWGLCSIDSAAGDNFCTQQNPQLVPAETLEQHIFATKGATISIGSMHYLVLI